MDLEGKVCVVTGGASGIGRAMAERFRAAGMRLVLGDVEDETLRRTVAELGGGAAGVTGCRCDVRIPEQVRALRDLADAQGGAHLVCLNAGVAAIGPLVRTSLETWRWLVEVNLMGVVHGLDSFLPGLVERGAGHVVMTASAAGLISAPALGAYAATKHAVVGLAATLRDELAGTGVGVSVVCPGTVNTRIFESERNRPADLPGETHTDPATTAAYRSVLAASVPPSVVAEAVFDAVTAGRLFVLPSPELDPLVEARLDEVRAAMRRS
jgi:NAD(P)-dependent dehydrogenase (short-subunit alcohol dehydrogenase family)